LRKYEVGRKVEKTRSKGGKEFEVSVIPGYEDV
jgi:hypothetical protein